MLSFETPRGLCPSLRAPSAAWEALQRVAAITLPGTRLLWMWLFDTAQQGRHYGLVAGAAQ